MHTQTHTATTTTTTISEYTTRISDNTWNFVTDEPAREFIIFHWVQRHRKKMYIYSYIKAIKKSENKYCLGENKNPSGQCMNEERKRNWNKHFSWIIVFSIHIWMGECISLNLTFWCGLSLSLYIARESFCHVDFVDKTACYIFHGLALSCVCVCVCFGSLDTELKHWVRGQTGHTMYELAITWHIYWLNFRLPILPFARTSMLYVNLFVSIMR